MSNIYILSDKKVKGAINLPVFEIEFIPQDINLKVYDAIIFTSKNGIYSIDSFNQDWKDIPSYAIAPLTADVIKEYGGKLVYTSSQSYGDDFAQELIPILKDKKAIFLRAQKVISNLDGILKDADIDLVDIAIYKTVIKKSIDKSLQPPKGSTIIFSSPSTIDGFFTHFTWDDSYKAVAIGRVTAAHLPNEIDCKVAPKPSLSGCVEFASNL
ncbi:MAG: uroporphyrinogen-III synthase [Campylobacterales bacterium]|nr:uroporphyrinogen-III synthase [Campylobacterales bacterium]